MDGCDDRRWGDTIWRVWLLDVYGSIHVCCHMYKIHNGWDKHDI